MSTLNLVLISSHMPDNAIWRSDRHLRFSILTTQLSILIALTAAPTFPAGTVFIPWSPGGQRSCLAHHCLLSSGIACCSTHSLHCCAMVTDIPKFQRLRTNVSIPIIFMWPSAQLGLCLCCHHARSKAQVPVPTELPGHGGEGKSSQWQPCQPLSCFCDSEDQAQAGHCVLTNHWGQQQLSKLFLDVYAMLTKQLPATTASL